MTHACRIHVSDGTHFMIGMLATQLNDLARNGTLSPNVIIRLNEYTCSVVAQGRKYITYIIVSFSHILDLL